MIKIKDIELKDAYIIKPRNKNIYFRIKNDTLEITLPRALNEKEINKIIKSNEDSIYKLYLRNKQNNQADNTIHIFGDEYKISFEADVKAYCEIRDKYFIIHSPINSESQKKSIVDMYLASELKKYVDKNFDGICKNFADIIRQKPIVKYTNVKTYFGKCYPRRNLIYLNINLARYPKVFILSTIIHEMCHFKYLNHQDGFYRLYESKFPKAKKYQHELRSIKYNDLY